MDVKKTKKRENVKPAAEKTAYFKNKAALSINSAVYPLEAIYGACYVFLDRAYIFLDKAGDNILVAIKGKSELSQKKLEDLVGEFHNELLNYSLRYQISNNNKTIREFIIGRALMSALGEEIEGINEEAGEEAREIKEDAPEEIEEWKGDDLGIAVPWEEKFGQKNLVSKSKSKTKPKIKIKIEAKTKAKK